MDIAVGAVTVLGRRRRDVTVRIADGMPTVHHIAIFICVGNRTSKVELRNIVHLSAYRIGEVYPQTEVPHSEIILYAAIENGICGPEIYEVIAVKDSVMVNVGIFAVAVLILVGDIRPCGLVDFAFLIVVPHSAAFVAPESVHRVADLVAIQHLRVFGVGRHIIELRPDVGHNRIVMDESECRLPIEMPSGDIVRTERQFEAPSLRATDIGIARGETRL